MKQLDNDPSIILPLMAEGSFDNPKRIDDSKGRPLSTHEIIERSKIQRHNSRIEGEKASNMATDIVKSA